MGSKATTPLAVGGIVGGVVGTTLAIISPGWIIAGIFVGCVGLGCMITSTILLTI